MFFSINLLSGNVLKTLQQKLALTLVVLSMDSHKNEDSGHHLQPHDTNLISRLLSYTIGIQVPKPIGIFAIIISHPDLQYDLTDMT